MSSTTGLKSASSAEPKKPSLGRFFVTRFGEPLFVRYQARFERMDQIQAEKAGERLGRIHYAIDRKHRLRTLSNLAMALPEIDPRRRALIAKGVFMHFGRIGGDFLRSPIRKFDEVTSNMAVDGFEHVEAAEARGKGIIALTGHFGNWERYAQYMVARGRKLSVIARDANQEGVQARVQAIREAAGVEVLSRGNSARHSLIKLRKNEMIGILADQNSYDCFVPFFGKMAGTVNGPAVLHQRTGATLLPMFCIWEDYGKYRVVVHPPVDPENTETDATQITAELNLALESIVRQYPEQWLWMHDRWKNSRREGLLEA